MKALVEEELVLVRQSDNSNCLLVKRYLFSLSTVIRKLDELHQFLGTNPFTRIEKRLADLQNDVDLLVCENARRFSGRYRK